MKVHPDTEGGGGNREMFELFTAAYEVLSDPGKRSTYDQVLVVPRAAYRAVCRPVLGWGRGVCAGCLGALVVCVLGVGSQAPAATAGAIGVGTRVGMGVGDTNLDDHGVFFCVW